jgi:type III secretory pathway component EscS
VTAQQWCALAILAAIVLASIVAICVQLYQAAGRVIDRNIEEAFNVYTDEAIALTEDEG